MAKIIEVRNLHWELVLKIGCRIISTQLAKNLENNVNLNELVFFDFSQFSRTFQRLTQGRLNGKIFLETFNGSAQLKPALKHLNFVGILLRSFWLFVPL